MTVLVCGSRLTNQFADALTVWDALEQRITRLPAGTNIIHGGAQGPDEFAHRIAKRHGYPVRRFRADWKNDGRRAGILRNLRMLDEQPDLVIAVWDGQSRGTAHTLTEARKRGIPVEVLRL
jgi:YspA, cpYpsA-related SLOG family